MSATVTAEHRTRVPVQAKQLDQSASAEIVVTVYVALPEVTGGDVGMSFRCNRKLDFDLEETIWRRTRAALLKTIKAAVGGVPPGGFSIQVGLELPDPWWAALNAALVEVVPHFAATGLRSTITSPGSGLADSLGSLLSDRP